MKSFYSRSLTIKTGAMIILVEMAVLASIGLYYINRFSVEVDEQIRTRLLMPGALMNRQRLRYESVSDKEVMTELVGEEFVDGLVVGADQKVYYALNPEDARKDVDAIPWLGMDGFGKTVREERIINQPGTDGDCLIGITPIFAYEGADPIFFACVKVKTRRSMEKKAAIAWVFIAGTALCLLATSAVIIFLMRKVVIGPIKILKENANLLASGDPDRQIDSDRAGTYRDDELGELAVSFVNMRGAIRKHIGELRDAEEKYRSIFENAVEGIYQASPSGRFLNANRSMAVILGYDSPGELMETVTNIGRQVYVRRDDRKRLLDILRKEDRVIGFEARLKRKDGTMIWGSITAFNVYGKDGNLRFHEGSFIDITERYEREKAVREREAAEASAKAKSEFLANMSHEIRTPMNAIIGMVHLIMKTRLSPKQYDYVTKIRDSSEALLRIINDILDFSKIEAGRLDMEHVAFDLEDALMNLSNMVGIKAEEKEIELILKTAPDVPLDLVGDPLRLCQILLNLTGNAVKFTNTGEIVILTELVKKEGGRVTLRFSVSDTGIGLTQDQIGGLFRPFSQADSSTTRKYGGTGLGLTISKYLVEMMGGEISVKSESGKGSTFSFTARFGCGPKTGNQISRYVSELGGTRVLVVDDNATSREIMNDALRSLGCEVSLSPTGPEGIREVMSAAKRGLPFNLVFMDWKMPGMDGIEAARIIQQSSVPARPPGIVLMTAYGREEVLRWAEQSGLDAFLFKPVSQSMLFDTIMGVMKKDAPVRPGIPYRISGETEILKQIRGARVLLVEDNEINQQVALELLEHAGFGVATVADGREAVAAVKKKRPDAVLMDIQMPVLDGYRATMEIRKWEAENAGKAENPLVIIAMTAHAMVGEREKCLAVGMDDYVTKPIDPGVLFSVLAKWIRPVDGNMEGLPAGRGGIEDEFPDRSAVLPCRLDGFDIPGGLERVAGNKKLYRELLVKFGQKWAETAERIEIALIENNAEHARELAHSVKGIAGNIGANDLFASAARLELALAGTAGNEVQPGLDRFAQELSRAVEAVRTLETESGSLPNMPPLKPVNAGKAIPILEELSNLLFTDLIEALERMRDLAPEFENTRLEAEFEHVVENLTIFDTDNTLAGIDRIIRELGGRQDAKAFSNRH